MRNTGRAWVRSEDQLEERLFENNNGGTSRGYRSCYSISYISSGPQLVKLWHFGMVGWVGQQPKVSLFDGIYFLINWTFKQMR